MSIDPELDNEKQQDETGWKTTINLVVVIFLIVLFAAGYFVINGLVKMKKSQICLEFSNKACQRLELSR